MASQPPTLLASMKCFGGVVQRFSHHSVCTGCEMKFSIFLPPKAEKERVPVLYFLSGLTCTDENFITKAGAQRAAARYNIALVSPDTSPRGLGIEGEKKDWDFGEGAGFYLNATQEPWSTGYRMYDYITKELPALINANFKVDPSRQSITGHSMGGHGALTIGLKNPNQYKSISAFAPICNPINCPWGIKAFTGYLGESNKEGWKEYDATELMKSYSGPIIPILIDQGTQDKFLIQKQLLPEGFVEAAVRKNFPLVFRMHDGYDHSYYFISTFIDDHIAFHAEHLGAH